MIGRRGPYPPEVLAASEDLSSQPQPGGHAPEGTLRRGDRQLRESTLTKARPRPRRCLFVADGRDDGPRRGDEEEAPALDPPASRRDQDGDGVTSKRSGDQGRWPDRLWLTGGYRGTASEKGDEERGPHGAPQRVLPIRRATIDCQQTTGDPGARTSARRVSRLFARVRYCNEQHRWLWRGS